MRVRCLNVGMVGQFWTRMADQAELLDALDEEQRRVATSIGGPVCVLAGAGTGKTRALTHRIAYGVSVGSYSPQRVLALTFTTRAAGELRSRLADLDATVQVRTFHSAALAQLNHFWPQITGHSAPNVLAGKAKTIADAASRIRIPIDVSTARDVAALIEWRKVRMLGMADLSTEFTLGRKSTPGRLSVDDTLQLLEAYEAINGERKQVDFEDVLLLTVGMLADETTIAEQVREQYRHFLVDEYQDVSPVQQALLDTWLGDRRDLCVVGDASQTIFSFAGATAHYLLDFSHRYDGAEVIELDRNYRSIPGIVDRANRLMRARAGAVALRAQRTGESVPTFTSYPSDSAEASAVASAIAAAIAAGVRANDIAVLYRVNAQSEAIERALAAQGVPYRVRGGVPFFDRPEIRQAVMQLRAEALSDDGTRPLFQAVSDVLWSLGWSTQPPAAEGAVRERWEALNVLAELADAEPVGTRIGAFVDTLRAQAEAGVEPANGAVTLATIHSAKGLEWKRVWVIGASEGLLPVNYVNGLEGIDEERRLMYVALTRAKDELAVSWAEAGPRGARSVSRFVTESNNRSRDEQAPSVS